MAHAGTIMGRGAQTKQSGSVWLALGLSVAIVIATVAVFWLASAAGPGGGTAKPAAGRSPDRVAAQGGALTLSGDAYLNGILDRAHATPYVAATALSTDTYLNAVLDRAHATPYVNDAAAPLLSATSGTFHPGNAQPVAVGAAAPLLSATSGTFHPGNAQTTAPVKRDPIGGP